MGLPEEERGGGVAVPGASRRSSSSSMAERSGRGKGLQCHSSPLARQAEETTESASTDDARAHARTQARTREGVE